MQKQTQQLVLMLIIGILIGTGAVMVWKLDRGMETANSEHSTPLGGTTTLEDLSAPTQTIGHSAIMLPEGPQIPNNTRVGLSVVDQPAGKMVTVSNLSLSANYWVAIYDDSKGRPGWILGAARVRAGETSATIELLRPTTSGGQYYAALLNDDGDDAFNRLTDLPPLSPDKVVIVAFKSL
jgi:hypothetical protein